MTRQGRMPGAACGGSGGSRRQVATATAAWPPVAPRRVARACCSPCGVSAASGGWWRGLRSARRSPCECPARRFGTYPMGRARGGQAREGGATTGEPARHRARLHRHRARKSRLRARSSASQQVHSRRHCACATGTFVLLRWLVLLPAPRLRRHPPSSHDRVGARQRSPRARSEPHGTPAPTCGLTARCSGHG